MEFFIQTTPIVAALLAVGKAVGFGHAPFHQRETRSILLVALSIDAVGLIGGDADGSFNGGRDIKRSEVAKILCTINRLA